MVKMITALDLENACTLRCVNAHIENYRFMKVSKGNIYPLFERGEDIKFQDDDGEEWLVTEDIYGNFEVSEWLD